MLEEREGLVRVVQVEVEGADVQGRAHAPGVEIRVDAKPLLEAVQGLHALVAFPVRQPHVVMKDRVLRGQGHGLGVDVHGLGPAPFAAQDDAQPVEVHEVVAAQHALGVDDPAQVFDRQVRGHGRNRVHDALGQVADHGPGLALGGAHGLVQVLLGLLVLALAQVLLCDVDLALRVERGDGVQLLEVGQGALVLHVAERLGELDERGHEDGVGLVGRHVGLDRLVHPAQPHEGVAAHGQCAGAVRPDDEDAVRAL